MLLSILHRTTLEYEEEIFDTTMEMRLRPRDDGGQRCIAYAIEVEPPGPVRSYRDALGNVVESYNHRPPHRRVVVSARSIVQTSPPAAEHEPLALSDRVRMLRLDGPVGDSPALRDLVGLFADPTLPVVPTPELLAAIAGFVRANFVYEQNVTAVDSSVTDVLRLGRGVCQDFAHVWIALCRVMNIPARYVSGYIWNGDDRQEQASHAWGEAWLDGQGWLGYDPTNWRIETGGRVGEQHVRVAVGRDYRDVPPTRGVYRGMASERLHVHVRVDSLARDQLPAARRTFETRADRLEARG